MVLGFLLASLNDLESALDAQNYKFRFRSDVGHVFYSRRSRSLREKLITNIIFAFLTIRTGWKGQEKPSIPIQNANPTFIFCGCHCWIPLPDILKNRRRSPIFITCQTFFGLCASYSNFVQHPPVGFDSIHRPKLLAQE